MMKKEKCKLIEVKDVKREYKMGETSVRALRGIDICVRKGDFIFIVGPSGSGKSTLMHILGALDHPTKGEVSLEGRAISQMSDFQLSMIRRNRIGFIFQTFNLVLTLNALDNVMLPLITDKATNSIDLEKRARKLLNDVGLGHRMFHTPNELSGGERQRVAIARALINSPEIILADEPTGNLDTATGDEIFALMRDLNKKLKTTFVIVTHDVEYIDDGDKIYQIKDGVIVENYTQKGKNHFKSKKPAPRSPGKDRKRG